MQNLTRLTTYRTSVNLKDLDQDGEDFHFSRASGELNKKLNEVVGKHEYKINLLLKPMGNVFEISGQIATNITCDCARCGRDVELPIAENFSELILVLEERPRAGHSGHTGSQLDEGPYCNYVTSHQFDLGDFVHEHIAAAEPYAPNCGRADCEQVFQNAQKSDSVGRLDANPFEVLKNLNLKSKS